jgi:hypothetical protein
VIVDVVGRDPRCQFDELHPLNSGIEFRVERQSNDEAGDRAGECDDEDRQQAMEALAESARAGAVGEQADSPSEGNLRAMGQSKIEKTLQVPAVQELVTSLANITERAGFEPPSPLHFRKRAFVTQPPSS